MMSDVTAMEVREVQEDLCIKQSELLIKVKWNKLQPFCCLTNSLKVTQSLHALSWCSNTHTHPLMVLILFSGSDLRALELDH